MLCEIGGKIYHNKNLLMLFSVGIYICSLFGTLNGQILIYTLLLSLFLAYFLIKNIFPTKIIIIWILLFVFGFTNTTLRLKKSDNLLSLAPANGTIYGQIVSIPETKSGKIKFFFKVDTFELPRKRLNFVNEKVLVSIDSEYKLRIYDSYKIRGRLSAPFRSGNPSQFDYSNYLQNFGTYAVFYGHNPYEMKDANLPCYEKLEKDLRIFQRILQWINNSREKIIKTHSNYLQTPYLEILGGIVFGDDAISPPDNIKQSFINSGLLHILAASGMNVAFIFSFFFFILNLFKVNHKVNISVCMLAIISYILMTGLGASIVRAGLMLLFVLFGKMIDRDAHSISLLSFVAFLMLIYNPMYINDVGFQLSFIVTFGLLVTTPFLIRNKNRFLNWLTGTICIPIIAQIWVIPIQIFYFNNISIYSIFANIMSVPILYVISFGGFISSLLALIEPISNIVCCCFDFILGPLLKLLVYISDFWGNLPNAAYQTMHPEIWQIILYYLLILNILILFDSGKRKLYGKTLRFIIPTLFFVLLMSTINIPNKNPEILVFNLGNADSFMIKTPDNKYIMIDTGKSGYNGGKSQAEMIIMKYLKDNGIKNIESIIITHFDNDHCGGVVDLVQNLKVNKLYVNSKNHESLSAKLIYSSANNNKTEVIEAYNNQKVYNDSNLKITNYISNDVAGIGDNESSIVTLLKYKDFNMLFMGDAGVKTFDKIKNNIPKNITVLKVGHHGASGVINKNMAEYLKPKYSIISTGENKFGHPSIYTTEILKDSVILRTDIDNAILITLLKNGKFDFKTYDSKKRKFTEYSKSSNNSF